MRLLLLTIFLAYSLTISAQKRYLVKAGESPLEVLPNEAVYVFPAFTAGTALLRDGTTSSQQFNYNFVLDEMQFLNAKGETLTIAEPVTIRSILIDSVTFYYDKTYLQEVYKAGTFKLAVKRTLVKTSDKKIGGYNMALGSGAITTYGSMRTTGSNSSYQKLRLNKDVYFEKSEAYYLGDEFNHFVKADKKGFLNMFSLKNDVLQKYLKGNDIEYHSLDDLKKLLKVCAE